MSVIKNKCNFACYNQFNRFILQMLSQENTQWKKKKSRAMSRANTTAAGGVTAIHKNYN